jgi:hypothetical protein
VKLFATANLDLTGPTVNFVATAANLEFNNGDIDIGVFCTDTICLIPVSLIPSKLVD